MEETLRDTVLKPIMKRKRQHQDRAKRKKPKKSRDKKQDTIVTGSKRRQKMAQVQIKSVDVDSLKNIVCSAIEESDMERVVQLKEEVDAYVKTMLYPLLESDQPSSNSWMNKMDRQDVLQLIRSLDPIPMATEKLITLPMTLSKLYDVSNFELLPSIYHKDHVWLTLQWSIDGVANPFMSRPCASTPCLGSHLMEGGALPELVPLTVLEKMMEWRSGGMTLEQFCIKLKDKRANPTDLTINYSLGRDTPFPPRCLLCYVQEAFSMAMVPERHLRRSITLDTYKRCCMVQFDDMRKDIMVDFDHYGMTWVLKETGVAVPKPMIPFPGLLVTLIKRKKNGEICIDDLFG